MGLQLGGLQGRVFGFVKTSGFSVLSGSYRAYNGYLTGFSGFGWVGGRIRRRLVFSQNPGLVPEKSKIGFLRGLALLKPIGLLG